MLQSGPINISLFLAFCLYFSVQISNKFRESCLVAILNAKTFEQNERYVLGERKRCLEISSSDFRFQLHAFFCILRRCSMSRAQCLFSRSAHFFSDTCTRTRKNIHTFSRNTHTHTHTHTRTQSYTHRRR